jgi:LacI family repressor for deo operon, udp, cdd, tsx, nupC, and nupG
MSAEEALSPFSKELIRRGDFSLQSGERAVNALLDGNAPFTTIFAANDAMAIGAIKALGAHCLRVPGDVSVMGFDDIEFAQYISAATNYHTSTAALDRSSLHAEDDAPAAGP